MHYYYDDDDILVFLHIYLMAWELGVRNELNWGTRRKSAG